MTIAIGRIGIATAYGGDGLALNEPFEWAIQGDQLTIRGVFVATSDAQAVRFQAQIAGLDPARNPDEQSVPITSTLAPTLNGYYTVTDAGATIERGSLGPGTGIVNWQVTAIRARDHLYPNIEISHSFALLTNNQGVTTAIPFLAVPTAAVVSRADFMTVASTTRVTEFGSVVQMKGGTGSAASYAPIVYAALPADYYQGACRISTSAGNIVGRGGLAAPGTTNVVLSNGIVRATIAGSSFTFAFWDDSTSAWESNKVMETFALAFPSDQLTNYGAAVLKNAADECTVRISTKVTNANRVYRFTVDYTVRRGDAYMRVVMSENGSQAMRAQTSTACTAVAPWGMRSTAADADGQYLLLAVSSGTLVTASGEVRASASVKATFMVGFSETTGAAGAYDVDNVLNGFFRTHGTAQRVVVG